MWFLLCLTALCAYLLLKHVQTRRKLKNYPPGPPRLPLLGCVLSMRGTMLHLQAERWSRRYGPLQGLLLGPVRAVTVTGPQEVLALLRHEHCQGRPQQFNIQHRSLGGKGIIFGTGSYWTQQRRFALRQLRDLGFGKTSLEGVIHDELLNTLDFMTKTGPFVEPKELFTVPMLNVLWCLVSGKAFSREDAAFRRMVFLMECVMRNKRMVNAPCDVWPALRHIAPGWSGYNEIYLPVFQMQDFIRNEIEEQRKAALGGTFISMYLQEIKDAEPGSGFSEDSLVMVCFDFFLAGGETSSNTLSFCLLYLTLHPEVQSKAREELNTVIGRGKIPVLADRPRLPYLEAVLSEVMRISPTAPLTPPHVCTQDISINGYILPKGTVCIMSLYAMMHNKQIWGDPENFRPERFLDSDGNFNRSQYMLPFGAGKRSCLGETSANQVMFIFLGGLISRFQFSLPPGTHPSTVPEPGLSLAPKPFKIIATPIVP